MVNTENFVERLKSIMDYYNLSATAFADEIKVQRSSISHLLTGRNKPSLDFVMKVVKKFPEVNLYWLLNGKGAFPSTPGKSPKQSTEIKNNSLQKPEVSPKRIKKIVFFYEDGSFETFGPDPD